MRRSHLPLLCALLLVPLTARSGEPTQEQREALTTYFENNSKFVDVAKQPLELLDSSRGAAFLSRYSDALLVVRLSNDLAETRDLEAFKKVVEKLEDVAMEQLFPDLKKVLGVIGWAKTGMELLKDLVVEPAVLDLVMDVYANNRRTLAPEEALGNLRAFGLVRTKVLEQFRKQYGDQVFTAEDRSELLPRWKERFDRSLPAWVEAQYQLRLVEEARRALRVKRAQAERDLAELDLALHAMLAGEPCPDHATRAENGRCRCVEGYRWSADATACAVDRDAQVAAKEGFCAPRHAKAYWDEGAGQPRCQCLAGYRVSEKGDDCVVDRDAQVAAKACRWPNSVAYWDEGDGAAQCRCVGGYRWVREQDACVVDKAAQVARADCSNAPGSRAYWDEGLGRPQCRFCNPGFHWRDGESLACEPDVSDAEAEAAASQAAAQIEQAFAQLFDAGTVHRERTREIEREWGRGRAELDKGRPRSDLDRTKASGGPTALDACVACVNALTSGACYVRVPRLAGWGLCLSCVEDGGVLPENRFIDTVKCPVCKGTGWRLESFKAYKHN